MAARWGGLRGSAQQADLRWFWSITVYVNPKLGIITSGRAASIDEAKAQFLTNWQKCRTDSTPPARSST
jgi:hypothetical protein